MHALMLGFAVAMLSLAGAAALLGLTRLVLMQVREVVRLSALISDPDDRPRSPWQFADCGQPPGWLLPPEHHSSYR